MSSRIMSSCRLLALALVLALGAAEVHALDLVVPVVGKTSGYWTDLTMSNGVASHQYQELIYNYTLDNGTHGSVSRWIHLTPRATLAYPDALSSLFGINEPSVGYIDIPNVSYAIVFQPVLRLLSQSAELPLIDKDCSGNMWTGASNAEQPVERTLYNGVNVILTETTGTWADVNLELIDSNGNTVAEQSFGVAPNQFLYIWDVFATLGLPEGDHTGMTLRATQLAGPGRVAATRMWQDYMYYGFDLKVVGVNGGSGGPTIGF